MRRDPSVPSLRQHSETDVNDTSVLKLVGQLATLVVSSQHRLHKSHYDALEVYSVNIAIG